MKPAILCTGLVAALALVPTVAAGGSAITANPASPTTASGVSFTVTTGGGNRDFTSVAVSCKVGAAVVYATILTIVVSPKGTGTSQTIYPPASSCTADLEKQAQIGKPGLLASTSFVVT